MDKIINDRTSLQLFTMISDHINYKRITSYFEIYCLERVQTIKFNHHNFKTIV